MEQLDDHSSSDFEQLDDFSLMNIFDYLAVDELVTVSELNGRFASIIAEHYIISKYQLDDRLINIFIEHPRCQIAYTVGEQYLPIASGLNQTLWVLKHFGYIFNTIRFEVSYFGNVESQKIFEYTAKYCTHAKKTISIEGVDTEQVANWTHSFDENTMHIELYTKNYNSVPLNEFFPFMQEISIFHTLDSIAHHFPHLTKCSLYSAHRNDYLMTFFQLNPQLIEFHDTIYNNERYVRYLNQMLPNLESLSIRICRDPIASLEREIIHFKNVKKFSMGIVGMDEVQSFRRDVLNITFDQLESFTLKRTPNHYTADLVQIIAANAGLEVVDTNIKMKSEQLQGLVKALPRLKEMTLYCYTGILIALQRLLSENHELEKIRLMHCVKESLEDLAELSPITWAVVAKGNFEYLLSRVNPTEFS